MKPIHTEDEVIVHPVQGMQLSEGAICDGQTKRFRGTLPGLAPYEGETKEEVLRQLEEEAKEYYGSDVVVEIISHSMAS